MNNNREFIRANYVRKYRNSNNIRWVVIKYRREEILSVNVLLTLSFSNVS